MTASVTSTAENAALSVADPSPTATGRLVNGAFSLPRRCRRAPEHAPIRGQPAAAVPLGPVGSSARRCSC